MLSAGINTVYLMGCVAKEPRWHRYTNMPSYLCFTLITKEHILKNGHVSEHCEYHQIKITDDKLDKSLQLSKNKYIYVKGRIKTTSYTDELNVKRYKTEIIANYIQLMYNAEIPVTANGMMEL